MKKVCNTLSVLFWAALTVTALIAVFFETELIDSGLLAGLSSKTELIITTFFELLTLLIIPLSLKLFKFKRVHNDLVQRKETALIMWGCGRLGMLSVMLIANTLLYYVYMNTAFGYMALIVLLCMPFVYPSMNRCLSETTDEE